MKTCPYCGLHAVLLPAEKIYHGRAGHGSWVWACAAWPNCDAYVGCHPGTQRALGSLANAPLRSLRIRCHERFDRLWLAGNMTRSEAYNWMQKELKLLKKEAHISRMSEEQCRSLLDALDWRSIAEAGRELGEALRSAHNDMPEVRELQHQRPDLPYATRLK